MQSRLLLVTASAAVIVCNALRAADPLPPEIIGVGSSNAQKSILWTPYPATDQYSVWSKTNVAGTFTNDVSGKISGFSWSGSNANTSAKFFKVGASTMSSNALLTANVLNRLAYGPTPDELERVLTGPTPIGPQGYINEQLAIEGLTDLSDAYVIAATNGASGNVPPWTNWVYVSVSGRTAGNSYTNLYVYLTGVGDAYVDDIQLYAVTNAVNTNNLIINGDFEVPLAGTWNVSTNLTGSSVDASASHSGASSLHLVSTSPGTTQGSSIWQSYATTNVLKSGELVNLSFWYLPGPGSKMITVRVSGEPRGTGGSAPPPPTWVYATATGIASATPTFYIYLNGAGEAYVDDVKLVAGSVPENGPNLLQNGDFESPLTGPWRLTQDFTNSFISSTLSHSGAGSLKIVATAAGSGNNDSIFQSNIVGVVNGQTYTVSFWYVPATRGQTLTARLSGSTTPGLLQTTPDTTLAGIRRRLDTIGTRYHDELDRLTVNQLGGVLLADLRAWYVQNAVGSKRQLLETLTQFLENHFVTEHSKSFDYFDGIYDGNIIEALATDWEYREITKWRNALANPTCTFYDLLKISAESPAMIVYLDTVNSKGNAGNIRTLLHGC